METFNIYKKRAGQDFESIGTIYAENYQEAKKKFGMACYRDLDNGKHGDNYVEETDEFINDLKQDGQNVDWYEGRGIYYNKELFLSYEEAVQGLDTFSEDVYTWTIDESQI